MATISAPTAPGIYGAAPVLAAPNNGSTSGIIKPGIVQPTPTPQTSNSTITRTSSAPAPVPTPQPTASVPAPAPTPAPSPAPAAASSSGINTYGLTPASGQAWYQLQNGESIANYNARIAAANPNLPAPGTTSSTGVTNSVGTTPTPSPAVTTSTNSSTQPTNTIGSTGTASGDNTFTGLINQEANTSAAGSPVASQAASGLLASGNSNPLTSGAAYQTYEDAVNKLADFKTRVASQFANLEASGEPLGLVTGREAALQAGYASQLDALQQEVTQSQQALGYGIQEQGQQQSGLSSAGNIGNTAQGTAQSGLGTAIGASAPSGSFPFVFNPQTGQFTNASTGSSMSPGFTGNYSSDTSKIAQAIMQGKTGYNDGEAALSSYYGNTADGNLTQAIIAAGGNPTVLKAQAAAQSSNVTAVGTAPVQAQLGVYNQQVANLGSSQVAAQQIGAFGDQLIATMSAPPTQGGLGINPYSSQYANMTLNAVKTQFSDPQYATFNTNIAGLQARVSALLSTGEIPTAATAGAQAIVSGNSTLQSMQATLQQIQAEAGAITGAQANVASTALQGAQSAAGGSSSGSTANPWH